MHSAYASAGCSCHIRAVERSRSCGRWQTTQGIPRRFCLSAVPVVLGFFPHSDPTPVSSFPISDLTSARLAATHSCCLFLSLSLIQSSPNSDRPAPRPRARKDGPSLRRIPRGAASLASRWAEMEGVVVRRVIPSDNSCLFNAVGYVMEHNRNKASELRQVIAATVASDPEKFNEAFLGKPNEAYCAWILDPEKWGGAIELAILSEYYGREIAAYDIQTTRCDLYGQEKKYNERAMLIYDGLHYDALAMSPFEGAPEEFDQTIFPVDHSRSIGQAEGLALNLVREAQRKRSYTDTANFTLRCGVCQIGVIGQKEAVEHAQATGHVNFQEYK